MDRVGADVRRELGRFGPAAGMSELLAVWAAAVGDGIARNAWPARLARDGTLHVHVSSSSWAFELTQLEATLRERLREHLAEATPPRLRFVVGPLPEPVREDVAQAPQRAAEPTENERAEAAALAAAVGDENLRKLVAKAAAFCFAKARSGRFLW